MFWVCRVKPRTSKPHTLWLAVIFKTSMEEFQILWCTLSPFLMFDALPIWSWLGSMVLVMAIYSCWDVSLDDLKHSEKELEAPEAGDMPVGWYEFGYDWYRDPALIGLYVIPLWLKTILASPPWSGSGTSCDSQKSKLLVKQLHSYIPNQPLRSTAWVTFPAIKAMKVWLDA